MSRPGNAAPAEAGPSIWWFAFGYFAAYVPYSALAKALSEGLLGYPAVPGTALLPVANIVSMIGMFLFISALRWWRFAGTRAFGPLKLPWPNRWTFLSGLGTATVIVTTTLAYTFGKSVSIVFMMLLMRGGVLVIAPLVDAWSGRKVGPRSWGALALSLASLFVAFAGRPSFGLHFGAVLDVVLYLGAYFVRLRLMSRLAKSDDPDLSRRYFVEEQMVATPVVVAALLVAAAVGPETVSGPLRMGLTALGAPAVWAFTALVGLLSQLTGIFGGLVLLDRRENTYCVPVNRASSMLAGLGATVALWLYTGEKAPDLHEVVGAGLVIAAIVVLSWPARRPGAG